MRNTKILIALAALMVSWPLMAAAEDLFYCGGKFTATSYGGFDKTPRSGSCVIQKQYTSCTETAATYQVSTTFWDATDTCNQYIQDACKGFTGTYHNPCYAQLSVAPTTTQQQIAQCNGNCPVQNNQYVNDQYMCGNFAYDSLKWMKDNHQIDGWAVTICLWDMNSQISKNTLSNIDPACADCHVVEVYPACNGQYCAYHYGQQAVCWNQPAMGDPVLSKDDIITIMKQTDKPAKCFENLDLLSPSQQPGSL